MIEVHRSCRPENSSSHLSDIRRDLCNMPRLHFSPRIDPTRKVLLHRPVLPALSQENLLTGTLSLFSHTSHQMNLKRNIAFQPMKDYWLSSRERKRNGWPWMEIQGRICGFISIYATTVLLSRVALVEAEAVTFSETAGAAATTGAS